MKIKENLYAYPFLDEMILHSVLRSSWLVISKEELELVKLRKYSVLLRRSRYDQELSGSIVFY